MYYRRPPDQRLVFIIKLFSILESHVFKRQMTRETQRKSQRLRWKWKRESTYRHARNNCYATLVRHSDRWGHRGLPRIQVILSVTDRNRSSCLVAKQMQEVPGWVELIKSHKSNRKTWREGRETRKQMTDVTVYCVGQSKRERCYQMISFLAQG